MDITDTENTETAAEAEAEVENADLQGQLEAALAEVENQKKEYLFLMADFDNFRKRTIKEKADLMKNAAERVLLGLLPILDDFERGLASTSDESGDAVREGMQLIYNKFVKYLESNGVKPMESTGQSFDADFHDAIATVPAPSDDLKDKVIDTTQRGYMLKDKVIRHAKVGGVK
ncbi:MAG: nucleotide exchange factor GrpE [Muribaculaceae bacterium]|nr:nucleotide exchange factor GrpE [Muribaculaceae bacterium]